MSVGTDEKLHEYVVDGVVYFGDEIDVDDHGNLVIDDPAGDTVAIFARSTWARVHREGHREEKA